MKEEPIKEKNKFEAIKTETLERKLKTAKSLQRLIIGSWILGFILYAYFGLIKDYEINNFLIVIWIFFILVVFSNGGKIDRIKKELTTRKDKTGANNGSVT